MTTCPATKRDGAPCKSTVNLCRSCGRCFTHCEHRADQAREARAKGGAGRAAQRREAARGERGGSKTVSPEQLPGPLVTLEDQVRWASWVTSSVATGVISEGVAREMNRGLQTLRVGLEKLDLLRQIRDLERQARESKNKRGGRTHD